MPFKFAPIRFLAANNSNWKNMEAPSPCQQKECKRSNPQKMNSSYDYYVPTSMDKNGEKKSYLI